jgi:hypothetical protein
LCLLKKKKNNEREREREGVEEGDVEYVLELITLYFYHYILHICKKKTWGQLSFLRVISLFTSLPCGK